jgi:general secretion pathway protein M
MNNIFVTEIINAWNKRELRERRILVGVFALVLLSLVFLVGVQPALTNIKNLEEYNPKLKQQAASMKEMAAQYSVIAKALSENVTPVTREFIESSLLRRNIKTQSLSVSNEIVRFQVNVVAYSNLMEWILEMQKVSRLSVEDVKLASLIEPGQVSVILTLRQQRVAN